MILTIKDEAFNDVFKPLYGDTSRYLVLKGSAGCLAAGTRVVMFDGSLKVVDDIRIGDKLMGIGGEARTVWNLYSGMDEMYEIHQNKGMNYTVNQDHVLRLKKGGDARTNKKHVLCDDYVNITVKDYLKKSNSFKRCFLGFRQAVEFPKQEVLIDPYFLGLWLGDGRNSSMQITNEDIEIEESIYSYAEEIGHTVKEFGKATTNAKDYYISRGYGGVSELRKWFKVYNLLNNKHIPQEYKSNTRTIRLEVLAGIIDTDGCLTGNCYDITLKDKSLVEDIKFVANSLGFRCSLNQCKKTIKSLGFTGTYYRLNISGNVQEIPVRVERKKIKRFNKNVDPYATGIKVNYVGRGVYFGFELDGDGLFFLEDFTVTHNSGKSEFCAQKLLIRTLTEPTHRFYCVRKVGKTIRNSQFKLLKDQISRYGMSKLFDIKETDMTIVCRVNGNEILSLGMDDREKIKSLTSPTGFWIEEVTELDRSDFNQLDIRLRGHSENYKQILMSFNPVSPVHWIKDRFFPEYVDEKAEKEKYANLPQKIDIGDKVIELNAKICHSNYKDNKFLPDEDRAQLENLKNIDINLYNVYCLGKWGVIGNLIYPNGFELIDFEKYPQHFDKVIYGLDFGYNNPSCLLRIGIIDIDDEKGMRKEAYVEELIYDRKLTNQDLIDLMVQEDIDRFDPIYADSQSAERIEEILRVTDEQGRPRFNVLLSDKSVEDGIDYVKRVKLYSHPGNVNINKEIKSYKWEEDNDNNPKEGKPVKFNDHGMDALRYALYTDSKVPDFKMAFIE